ncbi:stamen-specific protein FIL1-like [Mangifera indica]|uniref:stamen-specific protein FIL1-like n=1 Tax=Mangifera indica TaxID=29780 RepID=UPI001CFB13BF|nr:stamen-specific protein FIL1-like [Mangifera indica]
MAGLKSLVYLSSQAALLVLLIAVAAQTQMATSQSCASELNNLNVCAPFVVPGTNSASPSAECCNALQSVDHGCFCNTIRISARLPSQCNLPPLDCAN